MSLEVLDELSSYNFHEINPIEHEATQSNGCICIEACYADGKVLDEVVGDIPSRPQETFLGLCQQQTRQLQIIQLLLYGVLRLHVKVSEIPESGSVLQSV